MLLAEHGDSTDGSGDTTLVFKNPSGKFNGGITKQLEGVEVKLKTYQVEIDSKLFNNSLTASELAATSVLAASSSIICT